MRLESDQDLKKGAIAGIISSAVICLFMELMEMIGLVKHCWLFLAGQPVMQYNHSFWQGVLSFLIHLGIGACWGILIAFLFSKVFTPRYYLLKGMLISFAIFFLHLGLLNQVLKYPARLRQDPLTVFFIFLSYLIYGITTASIITKFPKTNQLKQR